MDNKMYFINSEKLRFAKWKLEYISLTKKLWGNIKVTKLIYARG
jgi:hypothetical protein